LGIIISLLTQLPSLIAAGQATVELFGSIRSMVQEDRSLTTDERAKIEALIDEKMAIVNDTSRDI
jgi:hypothetical protein